MDPAEDHEKCGPNRPTAESSCNNAGADRDGVSQHGFRGGNAFMLRMLNRYRDELQVTAPWWWMSTCATRPATSCRPRTRRGGPGFTSRRVIRRAGQSSNRVRRRRTGIAGNANDEDASAFEPHYTEITAADQVQIYEPIIGDPNGNVTTALLRGVRYLKDNRLLPDGFDKGTVDEAVAGPGRRRRRCRLHRPG